MQLPVLVVGSLFFYGYWDVTLIFVPLVLVVCAYLGGFLIDKVVDSPRRRLYLGLTITALMVPLLFFKYTNFILSDVLNPLFGCSFIEYDIPLPIGISFITFTIVAYVVDVYRRVAPVEAGLGTLTGYVMFFPQLVAGPIMRPNELVPQLQVRHAPSASNMKLGVVFFTIGLIKKLVFADHLAVTADAAFAMSQGLLGWDYAFGVLAFSVQIFCDFSGYTDMAIGAALFLGIVLPENFERPYLAQSVAEFWRKWHITLSLWIRDYLYIPLGGNRCSLFRQLFNVLISMSLCGLWHGASWNFVVWGGVHGMAIASSHVLRNQVGAKMVFPKALRVALTFLFVSLAWVLFRSQGLGHAVSMYKQLLFASYSGFQPWAEANLFPLLLVGVFGVFHFFDSRERLRRLVLAVNPFVLSGVIIISWLLVWLLGAQGANKFIYFDF